MDVLQAFFDKANLVSEQGLQGYLDHLIIDSRPPARIKKLLKDNPWEQDLLNLLVPLFETAAGFGECERRCAYITAPRGHSKTSILAMLCDWALVYSKRAINIVAAAADRDQAKILIDRCKAEAASNPWLKDKLTMRHYEVMGPMGTLTALSADAPTSSGLLADLYIIDELSWHRDRDLFDILFSGKDKRPTGCFIIISNAGVKGSWQHELWEISQKSPRWISHEVPPLSASWLDRKVIEEQRDTLPISLFRRLHLNIWTAPGEDNAFVTREQLQACMTGRRCPADRENSHILAIDYGMTRDRTALCVMHADEEGRIVLDNLERWQGNQSAHVQIDRIENWIQESLKDYRVSKLVLDAFQLEGTAQKFERYVDVERVNFGGNTLTKLAENLRSLIISQRIKFYPGAGSLPVKDRMEDIADELLDLQIVEKGNGWCWEHSEAGHDDGTCFTAGTMITTISGDMPIEDIQVGNWVLTRKGYRRVVRAGCTGSKPTMRITTSNGHTLTGSKEHPLMTPNGWNAIGNLQVNDTIHTWKLSSSTALPTGVILTPNIRAMPGIFRHTRNGRDRCNTCIETYGKHTMEQFLQGVTYIIGTETSLTMSQPTWNLSLRKNIQPDIQSRWLSSTAKHAGLPTKRRSRHRQSIVPIMSQVTCFNEQDHALNAARSLLLRRNMPSIVRTNVHVETMEDAGVQDVYNLTVEGVHEYFANGFLAHNCVIAMAALALVKERPYSLEVVLLNELGEDKEEEVIDEAIENMHWKDINLTCWGAR